MAKKKLRKARVYAMHAFTSPQDGKALCEYDELLYSLENRFLDVRIKDRDDIVAIVDVLRISGRIAIQFIYGAEDTITIFDQRTGKAKEAKLPNGQVSVATSWMFCEPGSRIVFIESRRPGVSPTRMAKLIKEFGRKVLNYPEFEFDFHPVVSANFKKELERFERVRAVEVVMKRPNKEWASMKELIGGASNSNAETIELSARAGRGKTLAKDRGIFKIVQNLSSRLISAITDVRVKGKMAGVEGEQKVSFAKNQQEVTYKVDESDSERDIARTAATEISQVDMSHLAPESDE